MIRRAAVLGLTMCLMIACTAKSSRAQGGLTFSRNDAADVSTWHKLTIRSTDINISGIYADLDESYDFRTFKVQVNTAYTPAGGSGALVDQVKLDWNGDGIYDAIAAPGTVTSLSYTYPQPANGVSEQHVVGVWVKFIGFGGRAFTRTCTVTITTYAAPRVFVNANGDAFVQPVNEDCTYKIPMLVVEGIDVLNHTFPNRVYADLFPLVQNSLRPQNVETFLLNFAQGGDDLRNNAAVVQSALDAIHTQCPNNDIALVGLSMGGLVCRYALVKLESQGAPHHVGLFISYDSPQQEACVNHQFQDVLRAVTISGVPLLDDLKAVFQSQAAKQLLEWDTYDPGPPEGPTSQHTLFFNELYGLGVDGIPHMCMNAAISNGALTPTYDRSLIGSPLISIRVHHGSDVPVDITATLTQRDVGPGCTYPNFAILRYGEVAKYLSFFDVYYEIFAQRDPVFIPTQSALDLVTPQMVDNASPITGWDRSRFDQIAYQPTTPLPHMALSSVGSSSVLSWLAWTTPLTVNYSLSGGGSTPPDVFPMNVLQGVVVSVPTKTVTVNGSPVVYTFDHWEDGSTQNPRRFLGAHAASHIANMVPLFSGQTTGWTRYWIRGENGSGASVATDANGLMYALYNRSSQYGIVFGQNLGSCNWSFTKIDSLNQWGFGDQLAIATGPQGMVVGACIKKTDFTTALLHLLRSTNPGSYRIWTPVDVATASVGPVSIKIDVAGTSHVAFTRPTPTPGVWYAAVNSSGLVTALEMVSQLPWAGANGVSLALDSQGHPAIAYSTAIGEWGPSASAGLGYARRVNGVWTTMGSNMYAEYISGWGCSLDFDAMDQPKISHLYVAGSTTILHYTRWSNATGAWVDTSFVSQVPVTALTTAMGVDHSSGLPRISLFSANSTPTLLWQTPTKWGLSAIDAPGSVVSNMSMSMLLGGQPIVGYSNSPLVSVAAGAIGASVDVTPPATVTNVQVYTGRTTAIATWTAPGDNGNVGTALSYDIRYSGQPITTDAVFNSATQIGAGGCPSPAGSSECVQMMGLPRGSGVYVAMKARDGAGNWSAMSNVGYGVTRNTGFDIMCDNSLNMTAGPPSTDGDGEDAPIRFAFDVASANPTSSPATIRLAIPSSMAGGALDISVFDAMGRRVRNLVSGDVKPGRVSMVWDLRRSDGSIAGAGVYFIRLRMPSQAMTRTLVVLPR
jgi:triacylglycerol esterase/lipase EstA (alpha/beta hydrolase family)